MIDKFQNSAHNFYIIARYAVPLMLSFGTVSLCLRLFHFDDAASIAMLIAMAVLGFLLVLPIITLLFPKVRLHGRPISDNEWLFCLFWIVLLLSIKIGIKISTY